jgi:hypothetical protein
MWSGLLHEGAGGAFEVDRQNTSRRAGRGPIAGAGRLEGPGRGGSGG